MPSVELARHLYRFFPELEGMETHVPGNTVAAVIHELERLHPGFAGYVIDERGALRKHVNIFVGGTLIRDRTALSDPVAEGDVLFVMQALSGG